MQFFLACIYEYVNIYEYRTVIILSPHLHFIYVIYSELSSYGLVDSCKINGITEQQVLQEAILEMGSEKGRRSSWLSLVPDLQGGGSQDQRCYT